MTAFLSGIRMLPNGLLVPSHFNPLKMGEYALSQQNCQKLKAELGLELKRSNFTEIKPFFEKRGAEFLIDMFHIDPWVNISNKGKSILENALQELNFNLPDETLAFLFKYYINHSEQAKTTNMNFLHVLVRNCDSGLSNVESLLKVGVEEEPELLRERLALGQGLDLTPVEMTIRTSYNEDLINFMVTKYQENAGCLTSEDKNKLLSHAKWLSYNGIYSTAQIGVRLVERIEDLPEVNP